MAIDEKKLIDELTEKIDEVLDDLEKDERYMPLHGYWYGLTLARRIVLKQPKLSLENKTSDNDVPDTNVGKWIPCSKELPKKSGMYYVSGKWKDKPEEVWLCQFLYLDYIGSGGWSNSARSHVVKAWMKVP